MDICFFNWDMYYSMLLICAAPAAPPAWPTASSFPFLCFSRNQEKGLPHTLPECLEFKFIVSGTERQ